LEAPSQIVSVILVDVVSSTPSITASELKAIAISCGFELAGIAQVAPLAEADHYMDWVRRGMPGGWDI
jgi:hypothetical protein